MHVGDVVPKDLKMALALAVSSTAIQEMVKRVTYKASGMSCFQRSGYTAMPSCIGQGWMSNHFALPPIPERLLICVLERLRSPD